jgi:hypothetical protein
MEWRIIVRMSLDGDGGSIVRSDVAAILEAEGVRRTKTGTYESARLSGIHCVLALKGLINALEPVLFPGPDQEARLDHLWIYADRVAD